MGGHGGLNILGQKSWNVYGQEQRAKVRRDEEEFAARDEEDPDAGSLPKGASGPAPRPAGHVGELPTAHHVTLAGHEGPVLACRFSRGGSYVLTCGKDRTFKLWNPFKGSLIKTYEGHAHEVATWRAPSTTRGSRRAAGTSRCSCGTSAPDRRYDASEGTKPR
jgi:mitogen-activated protein kinase organizer 1